MGTFRRRLRGLLLEPDHDGYGTQSSVSLSSANTGEEQMDNGGTSSQQNCQGPIQTDGHNFPQSGGDESPQQPPSSIDTGEEQQDGEKPPQRPPSYSAVFPNNCPGPQTPTPPGMDPLAIAAWHNKTYSQIYRLPDRILTQVIDMLDNGGVECIRRVARRFPPLCVEIIYDRPRSFFPTENHRGGPFAWPRLGSMSTMGQAQELLWVAEGRSGLPADRTQLTSLLDKDRYCDGCRTAREAPDWDQRAARLRRFLHCSVCLVDHPACLFSYSQRIRKPHRRLCIAHEGYLRICGHKEGIIRWSDVLDYKRKMVPPKDPDLVPLQCKDDSHIVLCKGITMDTIGNRSTLDPGCHVAMCQEYIYPSFQLRDKAIHLDWTAHLPLGRSEWPLTAAILRPRLAELRNNVGRLIRPSLAPGTGMDLPELCCFDPNSCDCIDYEDSLNILEINKGHTDPTEYMFPLEGLSRPGLKFQAEQSETCEFKARSHRDWRRDTITGIYGPGKSDIRAQPCHSGSQCLTVRYSRSIDISSMEINPHWYQALDPDSYSLTADRDGLGVYWCRQQWCRNYYGRIPGFSRIIYGDEYSRRCPRYCE